MTIRVALEHTTIYRYDRPVMLSPHVVRLRPAPHSRTPIEAYSLRVSPSEHFLNWQQDPFGNYQARLVFNKPASQLEVKVDLVAAMTTINPFDFFLEEDAEHFGFKYDPALGRELAPYLETAPQGPKFEQLLGRVRDDYTRTERRTVDVLVDINQLLSRSFRYDLRMDPGVFTPEEMITRGHGSCRDFAWLFAHLLRRLGVAARFVSGYSIQLKADQKPLEGPHGVDADCTDLHAWVEAFLPGAGWVGLDATNGLMCGEGHIPLACTAEPSTAAPVSGSFGFEPRHEGDEVEHSFEVKMRVTRIEDRPRPTKSYEEHQWAAILRCGDEVERQLEQDDVRLTMGGEPTFVSVDDMESPEWNTTALGENKERIADQLLRRLERRFAQGSLLHHGQGKWYPGEPLPRWAYSCYFRRDGQPIWTNPELFAEPNKGLSHGPEEALRFVSELCRSLDVDPAFAQPGFEDVFYYLWRERRLPANVDPFDSKLDDEVERARLRRVFQQGLDTTVGYTLPLEPLDDLGLRWGSGRWFLRDERLYLMPGDSPMGLRLPLDSLPYAVAGDRIDRPERDPMEQREPLPRYAELRARPGKGLERRMEQATPKRGESTPGIVRTAICIEPRDGMLHVFMPPVWSLEAYLALIAHIEDTARVLRLPVRIEGYHPPADPRMNRIQVTPDPGVIEVNIHPAHSFRELVSNTEILYSEARECRLGTEKFMLDGRHTGTGGGNHVVLGGATAADSPFLRRPDVLRSLIGFWINHPSLSYLFSGLFIGPTSQAPRVDEARNDSIYELELAFQQVRGPDLPSPPWLVDRIFRNLLVDVTGNTHRTEICIDKLYSPDASSGRQGLVELRAFEMPPDARMSVAQQLLVRALVAASWKKPYDKSPTRWDTALLDRFMLPWFVWHDFQDVIGELNSAGFRFDPAWFVPHFEFRFPLHGKVAAAGVELEIRHALEPWHVMGEEPGGGGTVRYVDSSLERLQVLVRGMNDHRHVVLANGRPVPLYPTGASGEYVAGVRYRAWQPPSALHPTIGVHSPVVFDLFDTWSGRAIGGATYYVSHPGGLSYSVLPSNGLEAEARRATRFAAFGHSPGTLVPPLARPTPELPLTLDLRRAR